MLYLSLKSLIHVFCLPNEMQETSEVVRGGRVHAHVVWSTCNQTPEHHSVSFLCLQKSTLASYWNMRRFTSLILEYIESFLSHWTVWRVFMISLAVIFSFLTLIKLCRDTNITQQSLVYKHTLDMLQHSTFSKTSFQLSLTVTSSVLIWWVHVQRITVQHNDFICADCESKVYMLSSRWRCYTLDCV